MRFSSLFTLALAAVPALSAITPAEMVNNINTLTSKSQAIQAPAQSISILNGPLIIIGLGPFPQIIAGFADIVTTATAANAAMQGSAKVTNPVDVTNIANAFREFVRVHQVLLNILIGKAGLFQTVPLIGAPVAAVLRQIETIVDTIALAIINGVEGTTDMMAQKNNLSVSIKLSIDAYDGLSLKKRGVEFSA